jgi:4'-phosphopantetheinyl transferase EntD
MGLGIDLEWIGRVERDHYSELFTPSEIAAIEAAPVEERSLITTCFFSAKEAIYKAQYPLTGQFVAFSEVSLCLSSVVLAGSNEGFLMLKRSSGALEALDISIFYRCEGPVIVTGAVARKSST